MNAPDPRLSINQATIKHADLATALRVTADAGVQAIGLWREPVQEVGLATAARMLTDSGLRFTTHCRSGFFTMPEGPARRASIDDNRVAIEEAATLAAAGAPGSTAILVLVVGGLPPLGEPGARDLVGARERVRDAIGELAPDAVAAGVTLAIEPLHPMYASDRCVVSTLGQALDIAADFPADVVAATVDTFHIWWDPDVLASIARAGAEGRIATYQVCDWKTPLPADVLLSRHYPGDGVIDFASLTDAVVATGYDRDIEVEIFNEQIWATDPAVAVAVAVAGFAASVSPHLPAGARRA
ncbi:sugar phosphate isomerase/epimerase family protein [Microbacterium telephonicum]|uniref:Sugar phosphate isomerase/epimerase n=1 Tax=Microbacterium telephonicum TaxID=1714841 RepID=A0A498CD29_9MICO|nr:sugar phosphate isomerase/epimerase family protein [Microbacterium telephonicum]RLK52466.1 sugar phosphate isomerase/epimerase [Microbacterium telephonicum]